MTVRAEDQRWRDWVSPVAHWDAVGRMVGFDRGISSGDRICTNLRHHVSLGSDQTFSRACDRMNSSNSPHSRRTGAAFAASRLGLWLTADQAHAIRQSLHVEGNCNFFMACLPKVLRIQFGACLRPSGAQLVSASGDIKRVTSVYETPCACQETLFPQNGRFYLRLGYELVEKVCMARGGW